MPNAAEKSIFFRRAAADIAQLPLIIEKSQQMAAKYWSYQQSGTFCQLHSRLQLLAAKKTPEAEFWRAAGQWVGLVSPDSGPPNGPEIALVA